MLKVTVTKIKGHPRGEVYHLDLVDPSGPSGRAINVRNQVRLEGVRALREACDVILEKDASSVQLMESAEGGPHLLNKEPSS